MSNDDSFPTEDELWEKTRSSDPRERADALYSLGHQAMHRGDYDAVAAFHAAEAEILLELNDDQYPRALVMQAMALDESGRSAEALEIIDEALTFARTVVNETILGEVTYTKANILGTLFRHEERLRNLESAISLFQSGGAPLRAGFALLDKGDELARQNRFAEAQIAFEESMSCFSASDESSMFGRARDRRASVMVDQGKLAEALQNLRDNVSLYEFLDEEERVMFAKYRVGWNLLALDRAAEALPLLRESRAFYAETQRHDTAADIDAHIVDALRALKEFTEAEDVARRMRAFFDATNNVPRLLVSDINLAKGAFARGDDIAAENLLWEVVNRANQYGFPRHARTARLLLAEYFVSNDAFEQAENALRDVTPEEWGENYAKRAAHLNVIGMIALGNKDRLHATAISRKVIEMAYMHDLYEENARAHLTLAHIAELDKDALESKALRAQAVALLLAGGCDAEARRISKLLLPAQGASRLEFEEHRDELPVRDDTGPIDILTEGTRPEWMDRAGWKERKDIPPESAS